MNRSPDDRQWTSSRGSTHVSPRHPHQRTGSTLTPLDIVTLAVVVFLISAVLGWVVLGWGVLGS